MNTEEIIKYINDLYDIEDSYEIEKTLIDYKLINLMDYNITAIMGHSGTGKTTLLKKISNNKHFLNINEDDNIIKILIDNYSIKIDEAFILLDKVGLSYVPAYKNNYKNLSNGEKFKFEFLFKLLSNDKNIFIDEFTSMIDRETAKKLCLNIEELLFQFNKKLFLCTCHFDILDYLNIEQIVDTNIQQITFSNKKKTLNQSSYQFMKLQEMNGKFLKDIII